MSPKFQAPRGMSDILPAAQPLRRRVVATMEEVCRLYGYRRIDTPAVEDTGLINDAPGQLRERGLGCQSESSEESGGEADEHSEQPTGRHGAAPIRISPAAAAGFPR